MLATGILAIVASSCVLVWTTTHARRPGGGGVLMLLALAMLLLGGGIGPPLIALVLGAALTRTGGPRGAAWPRLNARARRWLAARWEVLLGADVAAWLAILLSVAVVGQLVGPRAVPDSLVYGFMAAAFLFLPLSLVASFARDAA
jgi:hypothetical protein